MGTRGITEVIYEGQTVVSQYGQWDHYPSGQGVTAFEFIRGAGNIDNLKTNLKLVYEPSSEELEKIYAPYTDDRGLMTMDNGDKFSKQYPSLTRDTGAGILEVIANANEPVPIVRDLEFKSDDLFCEGVYTINLDNETFTTKYNDVETVIPFSDIYRIGVEDYLVRSKCPVYDYHKKLDTTAA